MFFLDARAYRAAAPFGSVSSAEPGASYAATLLQKLRCSVTCPACRRCKTWSSKAVGGQPIEAGMQPLSL